MKKPPFENAEYVRSVCPTTAMCVLQLPLHYLSVLCVLQLPLHYLICLSVGHNHYTTITPYLSALVTAIMLTRHRLHQSRALSVLSVTFAMYFAIIPQKQSFTVENATKHMFLNKNMHKCNKYMNIH